jgi:membrane fusion protein YbhG
MSGVRILNWPRGMGVVLLATTLAGCSGGKGAAALRAAGHVEATEVRVATKIGGTLRQLLVDEGDRVHSGQTLGRIDTVDLDLALKTAQADRDQAEADLRLMQSGYRSEDIAEAEARVAAAAAVLDQAEKQLKRMQGLLDAGSGTAKARDDALGRRDAAAAGLDGAREGLRKLRAGYRKEEIAAARARAAAASARIAQLQQQISDATIASPTTGIVTEKVAEQGELLPAGALILVITDLDGAWLNVYIPEPDLGRVRLGQPAQVLTDGGERRRGRVTFIASQAEFTPKNVQTRDERVKLVYKVKITLENTDGLFKPGMPGEAILEPAEASS